MEAVGDIDRAQRLAGLGRVHGQRIAGKVLLLVVLGLGPLDDLADFFIAVVVFELLLFALEQFLVLGFTEQQFMIEDFGG